MACLKVPVLFFLTALVLMPILSAEADNHMAADPKDADHKSHSGHGCGYNHPHHGHYGLHRYPYYPRYAPYHTHYHHGSPSSYSYVHVHHGAKAAWRK